MEVSWENEEVRGIVMAEGGRKEKKENNETGMGVDLRVRISEEKSNSSSISSL